jgi:hypothetical protein
MKISCKMLMAGFVRRKGAMSTVKHILYAGFYWAGVVMTLACIGVVLASNTDSMWAIEHSRFPLSWALGAGAILAFLGSEMCHSPLALPEEALDFESELAPEFEVVES